MRTRSIAVASFVLGSHIGIGIGVRHQGNAGRAGTEFALPRRMANLRIIVAGAAPRTFRPEATVVIFHGRHYSRVEVHTEQPRQPLVDASTASADQLRAVWGPFVGEAGTFEVRPPDVITMQATVAKNPSAMTKGAVSVFNYRRDGNTLTLTQVRTPSGPSSNPVTITLTHVE